MARFFCFATFFLISTVAFPQTVGVFEGQSDVGTVAHAGAAEFDPATKTYTVSGSGANMWATADDFHYVWKKVSGDVSVSAELAVITQGGDPHRKAVLMIRQSLDQDSAYADAALHGDGMASLQFRDAKGAATHEVQSNVSSPKGLRLSKRGDDFYMEIAGATGDFQLSGGSIRFALAEPFYVGIGVCAHNAERVEKASFSNVVVAPPAASKRSGKPSLYSTVETIAVASTDRRSVHVAPGLIESSRYTPDGSGLIFTMKGEGRRIPVDGGKPEAHAVPESANNEQSISPDGTAIYYQSDKSGSMQVWRMKADKSDPQQVTTGELTSRFPQVSPDGKLLAFVSNDPAIKDTLLRVMNIADGSIRVLAKLFSGQETRNVPSWSPDSRRLSFVSYQLVE